MSTVTPSAPGRSIHALGVDSQQLDVGSVRTPAPANQVGLGPMEHRPARRSTLLGQLGHVIGRATMVAVAAVIMATALAVAQPGAPLEPKAVVEASVRAPADAQWVRAKLKPEQAIVSRYSDGDRIVGRVDLAVPWPKTAPRDFDSVSLPIFAKDNDVEFRLDGDTLHLSYVSERGLRVALDNAGTFHLTNTKGDLHFLSVDADQLTFDDTRLERESMESRIQTLEEIVKSYSESGHGDAAAEARTTLAGVRAELAKLDAGKLIRSVY